MVVILYTGIGFILLSVIVNLIELKRFFRSLAILNKNSYGFGGKMAYPFRFFKHCFPKLAPILPDVVAFIIGGSLGLNAGFYGFILGTAASCILTLGIKLMLWVFKKQSDNGSFKEQMASI